MERHPTSERFHTILREHGELHDKKQLDYGTNDDPFANVRASEDFGIPSWIGTILRANDKMVRLASAARQYLETGEINMANEGVEDSLRDLGVYATIALVLFEEFSSEEWQVESVKLTSQFQAPGTVVSYPAGASFIPSHEAIAAPAGWHLLARNRKDDKCECGDPGDCNECSG